ncbi:MAG: PQQ-dependent sugar dehydrogenase, partial [Planctomycetes bacterium]|nr:PQQ-dependent sugar dehydrogenase [Planctomycetota bacterium]
PAGLAFAADGRVFYTEKETGRIRVIADGTLLEHPFASVPVNYAGDRGLLGIALHPNFNLQPRVYVFYTRSDTGAVSDDPQAVVDNRVVYFEADGNVASNGEIFVASLPAGSQAVRVGGRIAFSPDGTLFVGLGDLGNKFNAPNTDRLAGKILRYNDDGSIPANNPLADSPVFAWGLREPCGLCFDAATWMAFATDRNDGRLHEINRIESGKDYGWPEVAGLATTTEELEYAAAHGDYVDPILDSGNGSSPLIGVTINPGSKYGPDARLDLFHGLRDDGQVFRIQLSDTRTAALMTRSFANGFPAPITDVAFTPAGTLYIACENAILRVVPLP